MSGFTYKGEVNSLAPRQKDFINDALEKQGFKNAEINVQTLGKAGDNYMATVKRITVKECDGRILCMVGKIAPTNEIARMRTNMHVIFENEATMYDEILPKLVRQQIALGLPESKQLRYAKCYGTLLEEPHELILLEDLKDLNFTILDRFVPLNNETIRMVLKNFALLHSLSYVMKKKDPETFLSFKTKVIDAFSKMRDEEFKMYTQSIESDCLNVLDDEKHKSGIRNTLSKMFEINDEIMPDQADLNQSVVIQGDGWTNNIMFRLEDNKIEECIMIDYQLSKVSVPACDLLYMIFNCTDYETRCKHYDEWIQYYHNEMDQSLSNFGLNINMFYTKDQLDYDLKKYSKLFIGISIMLSSILIRKPEDAAKVKEAMESGGKPEDMIKSFNTSNLDADSVALFKRKMEGIIDSYRLLGYIK